MKDVLHIGNFFMQRSLSTSKIGFTKKVKKSIVTRVLRDLGKYI